MEIKAIIFDLDGVIVSTDEYHYLAWKKMAEDEGIYFDRDINERLRGVSRMESLDIILERAPRTYSEEEKQELAARKNALYRQLIVGITPRDILPGVMPLLINLKEKGLMMAIGSSSSNCVEIMDRIALSSIFDAIVGGQDIKNSKPDPEVFLLAAERLGLSPKNCLVVEDADAGIAAALAAGMLALGVGSASKSPRAHFVAPSLESITLEEIMARVERLG